MGFQDGFQDEVGRAVVEVDVGVELQIEGGRCDRSGASGRGDDAIADFGIVHQATGTRGRAIGLVLT